MNSRVKELRLKLGLTQAEFADKLGVKNTAVSKIEKKEARLTEQNIKLICSTWNVNEVWLRSGSGDIFQETENLTADEVKLIETYRALLPENQKFASKTIEGLLKTQQALTGEKAPPEKGEEDSGLSPQKAAG
jgi:transcriptional regulator with XRE-family HTH domain